MSDRLGFVRCDKLTYLEMMDLVDKPGLFVFKTRWVFSYPVSETSQLETVDLAISN
jgi:hypothetical protein